MEESKKALIKSKRYFIWRDESGDVHCDVLVGDTHTYPLLIFGVKLSPFDSYSYGRGVTAASVELTVSILMDYFSGDNSLSEFQQMYGEIFRKFADTFLGTHRADSQNFYIDELEIKLFIETYDKEVEIGT